MKISIVLLSAFFIFLSMFSHSTAQDFFPLSVDRLVGEKAPDFTLKDLNGKEVTLSSFRGKPVLLNFWATWCPYCKKERPHLKSLYEAYTGKDLVIVSVAVKSPESQIRRFMEQNPAPFIVLPDPEGWADVPYNIMSLPTTFFIDRDGRVSKKFMGMQEWSEKRIIDYIDALISRKTSDN